jgi:HEAT repeat protein
VAGDPARRADAIGVLARMPEAAIPHVGAALASREPSVRRAVIEALGRRAHPAASAYVLTALSDADASVRQLAVTVLSRLGTRGVAHAFADLASSDPSDGVRRAAEIALRRVGKGLDAAPPLDAP